MIGMRLISRMSRPMPPSVKYRVVAGPLTSKLLRPPSRKTKDRVPREIVDAARAAIAHGRTVTVSLSARFWVRPLLGLWVLVAFAVTAAVVKVVPMPEVGRMLGLLLPPALVVATLTLAVVLGRQTPTRLAGRAVSGPQRSSTELWAEAIRQVEAGRRSEDDLPALHHAALAVANAEDTVSRLTTKAKYQLDQSAADQARVELVTLTAALRAQLGLPELLDSSAYLGNRWAENAGLDGSVEVNPDDLR